MMPQGEQFDIDYSKDLCEFLGIKNYTVNIKDAVDGVYKAIGESFEVTQQTRFNLPARIRMAAVYAVSQSNNGRVANTCNYSEDYVGYATRYGDGAEISAPFPVSPSPRSRPWEDTSDFPRNLSKKPPIDGLCGKTDEDNLGFTYATLDKYIREGVEPDPDTKAKIDRMREISKFKLEYMPCFKYFG